MGKRSLKGFTLKNRTSNKKHANTSARGYRKNGHNARVVKERGAYSLYVKKGW